MMNETHPWGGNVPGAAVRWEARARVQACADTGCGGIGWVESVGLYPIRVEPGVRRTVGQRYKPSPPRWRAKSLERL